MSSIDALTAAWVARGWLALLAFTAAVLVLAALRKPCRRLFGTERAFQLWLLPPLALLASQLPHATVAPVLVLSPVVSAVASMGTLLPVRVVGPDGVDWLAWAMLLWLAGSAPACCWRLWHKRVIAGGCVMPPASWTNVRAGRCCVQPVRTSGPPWSGLGAAASCCRRISNTATTPPSKC
jgi:hypothetical protein